MTDFIRSTYGGSTTKIGPYQRRQTTNDVQSHADEKQEQPLHWNRIERRRGHDRRRRGASKDPKFEMRGSRGRRYSDRPYRGVSTKA